MPKVIQPKPFNPRKTLFVATVLIVLFIVMVTRGRPGPPHLVFNGQTMGTSYSVKITRSTLSPRAARDLNDALRAELHEINRQMSTYLADSEISRFNQTDSTETFSVSPGFVTVTRAALDLATRSGGLFDPTLDPLIKLWGVGLYFGQTDPPTDSQVEEALAVVGYQHLHLPSPTTIRKDIPDLRINLGAIAKGYAVDRLALILEQAGLSNTFIEIGGEIAAAGTDPSNQVWRVGIQTPRRGKAKGELFAVIEANHRAVATSGDYRQYFQGPDGKYYTHIIDPRSGRPVEHALASVAVIAKNGMTADGLATALFAMGSEKGLEWIEAISDVEALFIVRDKRTGFREQMSSGFQSASNYRRIAK